MGLAKLGEKVRNLKEHGLAEGASTRLLIYAGKMIAGGIEPRRACQVAGQLGRHGRSLPAGQRGRSDQFHIRVILQKESPLPSWERARVRATPPEHAQLLYATNFRYRTLS